MENYKKELFSERLRELRAKLNLTQKDFASRVNITPATLSSYESGQKKPTIQTAAQIATEYNISLDWLCGISNEKEGKTEKPTLVPLLKNLSFLFSELTLDEMLYDRENKVIIIKSWALVSYFDTIMSLRQLRDNGTLDEDMFNACIETASKKTATALEMERHIKDDEDVPF